MFYHNFACTPAESFYSCSMCTLLPERVMDCIDIVKSRRTIRLFKQDAISEDLLLELVDAARLAPSASNIQPLEYIVYPAAR